MATVYIDDGGHVFPRKGTILGVTDGLVRLSQTDGRVVDLPVARIVRIEYGDGEVS